MGLFSWLSDWLFGVSYPSFTIRDSQCTLGSPCVFTIKKFGTATSYSIIALYTKGAAGEIITKQLIRFEATDTTKTVSVQSAAQGKFTATIKAVRYARIGYGVAIGTVSATVGVTLPALLPLALTGSSINENAAQGTLIGAILNKSANSVIALADSAGGKVALSGNNLVVGATNTDFETVGSSFSIQLTETLAGAPGSPLTTPFTINVANVFEQPNLSALTLSAATFLTTVSSSGTILGATVGSTIIVTGAPAGLVVNGTLRTWAWDGTGSAGSGSFTMTETLADSANSPLVSTFNYTITASPGTLQVLTLSASSLPENSAAGTLVGTVQNTTAGSVLTLSDSAGSRFAVSGGNIVAGATATNYESATSHNITIVETLTGATGNPKSTTVTINVTNVFEQPNLSALAFSATTFLTGATASGSITGATTSSTIVASGLPTGLTIDGTLRTWAWDGTGSVSSGTFTLTETLSDSANSPRVTTISYSIATLATPTLTNFSALGTAPAVLMMSTTDYVAGYRAQLQIDNNSDFSSPEQNIIFFIDGDSWARADEAVGLVTPSGTYYARIRIVRDNESGATTVTGKDPLGNSLSFGADISGWSNTFTDTIVVSVAALTTTTGTSKKSLMNVSGGPPALTFTGSSGVGAYQPVRATIQAQSSKVQFEVTVVAMNGTTTLPAVGFDDGTSDFNSGFKCPGNGDNLGLAIRYSTAEVKVHWNTDANSFTFASSAGVIAVGDKLVVRLDSAAHTMDVYRIRSGVETKLGAQATALPTLTAYYAYAATTQAESGTFNFGATAFAKALDNGYAIYG